MCPSDDETHSLRSDLLFFQTQLAQKTTLISDSKLKEQEFGEQIHNLEDRLKKYEKNVYATTVGTPYRGRSDFSSCYPCISCVGGLLDDFYFCLC